MTGPSTHLTWKELACNDGTAYPQDFILDGRVFRLARAFEDIRHLCGDEPITVVSAYRTHTWNQKIGGAPKSQHVQGRALDLKPPKGLNVRQFFDIIKANHKELGVWGLGLYKTFVHIDIRHTPRLITWTSTIAKESRA